MMQVSVPAWFTMDTRLGSISVHLDTPQCFSAEMYAVDLNVAGASEELKVLGCTSCSLANSDSSHYLKATIVVSLWTLLSLLFNLPPVLLALSFT
jgi:hypothetical protein